MGSGKVEKERERRMMMMVMKMMMKSQWIGNEKRGRLWKNTVSIQCHLW